MVEEETYIEDLKTGNIQYTDEVLPLLLRVQSLVTFFHQPFEQPVEHCFRHGAHRIRDLILVTTLGDELVTDLDPWFQQVLVKIGTVATQQFGHAFTFLQPSRNNISIPISKGKKLIRIRRTNKYLCAIGLGLLLSTPLLELHTTHVHHSGGDLVDVVLLLLGETQHVEGLLSFEENKEIY